MLNHELTQFARTHQFTGKGPLCVALVVTQQARDLGLPLDADMLLTEGGGQVLGLGRSAVQAILARHAIARVLAAEGGRTSRGSIGNMREYVGLLNRLQDQEIIDLDAIEAFWVARVREFFAAKPFKMRMDQAQGLRPLVRDLLEQAAERQKETAGTMYAGAVLQHLVGAVLDYILGSGKLKHNSFTTSDAQTGRSGDFLIGDVAIHVTVSPGEAVIERCRDNLNDGYRPMLVTMRRGVTVAEALADNAGLAKRIDVFEIEQFIALNLHERSQFTAAGRHTAVTELAERYNDIIDTVETDPSLKIAF